MTSAPEENTLALIGGYGKMGVWILDFLSSRGLLERLTVTVTGPREAMGRRVSLRYGVSYSRDNSAAAGSRHIVICTPLNLAPSVLSEIAPALGPAHLVMDICSVKTHICAEAKRVLPKGTEYVSVHPMFGPSVADLEGQVAILVPVRGSKLLTTLRRFLDDSRARTIVTEPDVHDYALGVVQCLTHFAYLSVGATLKDLDFDIRGSRSFSSPVYELMLDMIGRILSGDPSMYAEIQMSNPHSARIEELFLKNASELKSAVDAGDAEAFKRMMVEAGKHYDDLESAHSKSSRAVSALYGEYLKLKESVGTRVAVRNVATGALHVGVLREMTPDEIAIGTGKRPKRLKTTNVSLLPPQDARRERISKYGTTMRDVSFVFPASSEPGEIAVMLERCDEDLVSAKVIDEYQGSEIPEGSLSITFRLEIFGDLKPGPAEKGVRNLLRAMGGFER